MNDSSLHFKDLPAEVRNLIYNYALVEDQPVSLPYGYEKNAFEEPGLLLTNRWIRSEAAAIYYGCNTFEAPSPPSAQKFLKSLKAENIAQLRYFRPMDCVLPLSAHKRWFDAVSRNINRLVNPHGKNSLNADAIFLPVCTREEVMWCQLKQIREFEIVNGCGRDWSIEWRDEASKVLNTSSLRCEVSPV